MKKTHGAIDERVTRTLKLLDIHYSTFWAVAGVAKENEHPVPVDTRAWSQIIVSQLTGKKGLARKKGADLADGSDVKAASTWEAIDTPRFNGVLKAGTRAETAGRIESLNNTPHLFFVLWDYAPHRQHARCRIWVVRPQRDRAFRDMAAAWFKKRDDGGIVSSNFQLHPPRNRDSNEIRNKCGNMEYPLLFCAERVGDRYQLVEHNPKVLVSGKCKPTA